jgi:hypothetical protein
MTIANTSIVLPNWWWRRLVFLSFDEETHTTKWNAYPTEDPEYSFSMEWNQWHKRDELFAFRYELLRRFGFAELPEFPQLQYGLRHSVLTGILGPPKERSVVQISSDKPSGYASFGDWQWDLTASDEALCRHFLLFMNEARMKAGIPDTSLPFLKPKNLKTSRRGKRNRHVSWLAVEAFDLRQSGSRPLSDGERSVLSKAKSEIVELGNRCVEALAAAEKFFRYSEESSSSPNLYSRFLRENFGRKASKLLPSI